MRRGIRRRWLRLTLLLLGVLTAPAGRSQVASGEQRDRWRSDLLTEIQAALGARTLDACRTQLSRSEKLLERASGPSAAVLRRRWLLVAGLLLHSRFDLAGAQERFQSLLISDPHSAEALLAMGAVQEAGAAFSDPVLAFSVAAGKGFFDRTRRDEIAAGAARYYRDALAVEPELHEARLRLGRVLQFRKRFGEARPELEKVAASSAAVSLRYLAHLFLGDLAEGRQEWNQAQAHYRAAIALAPRAQSAGLALAEASARSGDEATAHAQVRAVLENADGTNGETDPWTVYFHPGPSRLSAALARLDEAATEAAWELAP